MDMMADHRLRTDTSADRRLAGVRFSPENLEQILAFSSHLACCCRDGRILAINRAGARLLGYGDPQEMVGRPFDDILSSDYAGLNFIDLVLSDGEPTLAMVCRADGSKTGFNFSVGWARELGPGTMVVRADDISQSMGMSSDILGSETRFRALVDNALDMICSFRDGEVKYINRAGLLLLGAVDAQSIVGRPIADLFHDDYAPIFDDEDAMGELFRDEGLFPAQLKRFDGTTVNVQVAINATAGDTSEYMIQARDITAHRNAVMALHDMNQELEHRVRDRTRALSDEVARRREVEEQLRHMATHDSLTGLPNRRVLVDHLESAVRRARRERHKVALLYIDLDGFKSINDTHGHDGGDLVLREVAARLHDQTRETDTIARIGGDEFVILYTDINDSSEATLLAGRILDSLCKPIALPDGHDGIVGASIGIAFYPDHGNDHQAIMKAADGIMFAVKRRGKNNFMIAVDADQ